VFLYFNPHAYRSLSPGIYLILLILADGCLGRALAIEFVREARCLALLDVQKKLLDDLKHSLKLIYGKDH
jgi:hypothetical protein